MPARRNITASCAGWCLPAGECGIMVDLFGNKVENQHVRRSPCSPTSRGHSSFLTGYLQHGCGEDHSLQAAAGGEVQLEETELAALQDGGQLHHPQQEAGHWLPPGPVPAQHLLPAGGQSGRHQVQAAE